MHKMRRFQIIVMSALLICVLSGCNNYAKEYDKNTLVVKGNGSLVEVAVESFADSSVQPEDLNAYIDEQIDAYNEEQGKKVVKNQSIDTEDMSKVKLVLSYKDMEAYNGFNLLDCVLDDFSNVDGDRIKGTYTAADGSSVKAADLDVGDKAKVLILSEAANVVVKGEILYYNKEVKVKNDVASVTGKGDAVIIFK